MLDRAKQVGHHHVYQAVMRRGIRGGSNGGGESRGYEEGRGCEEGRSCEEKAALLCNGIVVQPYVVMEGLQRAHEDT